MAALPAVAGGVAGAIIAPVPHAVVVGALCGLIISLCTTRPENEDEE